MPETCSGKITAVLEADPDPEGHAGDQALAVVHPVLDDDPHADHEEQAQQNRDVGRRNRPRYRQHDGERLWNERHHDERDPECDAHAAGAYARERGHGYARGIGCVGHGPHQAGEQVAHAVRAHRPLHRPKIHRARLAPGDALDGDTVAHRFDGADQGHEDEGRQQPPEDRPEFDIEARPSARWHTHPRRSGDAGDVVEAEVPGNPAAGDDADDRRPESERARGFQ